MRWAGKVGFRFTVKGEHSVWTEEIKERNYKGDVVRNTYRNSQGESINDNIAVNNSISIVADPYALSNFTSIIYCIWKGVKVKVNSVEIQHPRIILSLGGEYNEQST